MDSLTWAYRSYSIPTSFVWVVLKSETATHFLPASAHFESSNQIRRCNKPKILFDKIDQFSTMILNCGIWEQDKKKGRCHSRKQKYVAMG